MATDLVGDGGGPMDGGGDVGGDDIYHQHNIILERLATLSDEAWANFDTTGDGKIGYPEFKEIFAADIANGQLSESALRNFFIDFDHNKDGTLDLKEFSDAKDVQKSLMEEVDLFLDIFDKENADGAMGPDDERFISKDNWDQTNFDRFNERYQSANPGAEPIDFNNVAFEDLDVDGDGRLDKAELQQFGIQQAQQGAGGFGASKRVQSRLFGKNGSGGWNDQRQIAAGDPNVLTNVYYKVRDQPVKVYATKTQAAQARGQLASAEEGGELATVPAGTFLFCRQQGKQDAVIKVESVGPPHPQTKDTVDRKKGDPKPLVGWVLTHVQDDWFLDQQKLDSSNVSGLYDVRIVVKSAKSLPQMDWVYQASSLMQNKADPYVKVGYNNKEFQTEVKTQDLNPIWDGRQDGAIFHDIFESKRKIEDVTFTVMDQDSLTADEVIGTCRLGDIKDLWSLEKWENLWSSGTNPRDYRLAIWEQGDGSSARVKRRNKELNTDSFLIISVQIRILAPQRNKPDQIARRLGQQGLKADDKVDALRSLVVQASRSPDILRKSGRANLRAAAALLSSPHQPIVKATSLALREIVTKMEKKARGLELLESDQNSQDQSAIEIIFNAAYEALDQETVQANIQQITKLYRLICERLGKVQDQDMQLLSLVQEGHREAEGLGAQQKAARLKTIYAGLRRLMQPNKSEEYKKKVGDIMQNALRDAERVPSDVKQEMYKTLHVMQTREGDRGVSVYAEQFQMIKQNNSLEANFREYESQKQGFQNIASTPSIISQNQSLYHPTMGGGYGAAPAAQQEVLDKDKHEMVPGLIDLNQSTSEVGTLIREGTVNAQGFFSTVIDNLAQIKDSGDGQPAIDRQQIELKIESANVENNWISKNQIHKLSYHIGGPQAMVKRTERLIKNMIELKEDDVVKYLYQGREFAGTIRRLEKRNGTHTGRVVFVAQTTPQAETTVPAYALAKAECHVTIVVQRCSRLKQYSGGVGAWFGGGDVVDPYVNVTLHCDDPKIKVPKKTSVKKDNNNPEWTDEVLEWGPTNRFITQADLTVYDEDSLMSGGGGDDFLGAVSIKLDHQFWNRGVQPQTKKLYKSPGYPPSGPEAEGMLAFTVEATIRPVEALLVARDVYDANKARDEKRAEYARKHAFDAKANKKPRPKYITPSKPGKAPNEKALRACWDFFDTYSDDRLTIDEFNTLLRTVRDLSKKAGKDLGVKEENFQSQWDEADANNDDHIDFNEFRSYMTSHPKVFEWANKMTVKHNAKGNLLESRQSELTERVRTKTRELRHLHTEREKLTRRIGWNRTPANQKAMNTLVDKIEHQRRDMQLAKRSLKDVEKALALNEKGLQLETLKDEIRDRQFENEQLARAMQWIKQAATEGELQPLDANGDGKITIPELNAAMGKNYGNVDLAKQVFKLLDTKRGLSAYIDLGDYEEACEMLKPSSFGAANLHRSASVEQLMERLEQQGCYDAKWLGSHIGMIKEFMDRNDPPCTWPRFKQRLVKEMDRYSTRSGQCSGQCGACDRIGHWSGKVERLHLKGRKKYSQYDLGDAIRDVAFRLVEVEICGHFYKRNGEQRGYGDDVYSDGKLTCGELLDTMHYDDGESMGFDANTLRQFFRTADGDRNGYLDVKDFDVHRWGPTDVARFVEKLSTKNCTFDHYAPLFVAHDIEGRHLENLQDSDLKAMGVRELGTRTALLEKIQEFTSSNNHFSNPSGGGGGSKARSRGRQRYKDVGYKQRPREFNREEKSPERPRRRRQETRQDSGGGFLAGLSGLFSSW